MNVKFDWNEEYAVLNWLPITTISIHAQNNIICYTNQCPTKICRKRFPVIVHPLVRQNIKSYSCLLNLTCRTAKIKTLHNNNCKNVFNGIFNFRYYQYWKIALSVGKWFFERRVLSWKWNKRGEMLNNGMSNGR